MRADISGLHCVEITGGPCLQCYCCVIDNNT